MARSPEYPDLPWVEPRSWTNANRTAVQLVVIHTTEGSAHGQSAEDGAAYDARRTDGTSTHYFHDSTSTVQCVRTADQAHTARAQGNRRGIHHELCTRAGSANWADAYHQAMLQRAAKQAARDARKWGIPVRHLTVDQVAAGAKGFCGHWDVTRAFPQDNGTHTDPGPRFPWSQFLDMVRAELDGDDMDWSDDVITNPSWRADSKTNPTVQVKFAIADAWNQARAANVNSAKALALVTQLAGKDFTDEPAIVAGVLEGLGGSAESDAELAATLRAALGDRAAEVGRLLAGS